MSRTTRFACLFTLASFAATLPAAAQQAAPAAAPAGGGVIQRSIAWGTAKLTPSSGDGFYLEMGHMVPGAGLIKAGPGFRLALFGDTAKLDASAAVSNRRYTMARVSLDRAPERAGRVTLGVGATYQDARHVNDYGIGATTPAGTVTSFRIRTVDVSGSTRVRLTRSLSLGGRAGEARVLTFTRASADPAAFDPGSAASGGNRYRHAEVSLEADLRDTPDYPARGGVYRFTATAFAAAGSQGHSFRLYDIDAAHYLRVPATLGTLAVRGRMMLSQASSGNTIPMYLLPNIGGGNTLRGYADFRFRDRNAAVVSAEYRWRLFMLMDAALFTDIGSVAASPEALVHARRMRDYGVGVRLHSPTRTLARVDLARGSEGIRLSVSLSAPFGSHRDIVLPYVP